MAVQDHGLEVLKKAGFDESGNKTNYSIQTRPTSFGAFSPPIETDYIGRTVLGAVETYVYKQGGSGGTTLATVTVTYTASDLDSLVSVVIS